MKSLFDSESAPEFAAIKVPHAETHSSAILINQLKDYFDRIPVYRSIAVVCIGTDRSTGDSLGPLIGSRLQHFNLSGLALYGTLDEPVHAMNLKDTMNNILTDHVNPCIIGIDACLGQLTSVGHIQLAPGPLKPGAGVNKDLPPVGDIHMTGIVNVGGFMEYFVLQNTRLSLVMRMSEVMAHVLKSAFTQSRRLSPFAASHPGSAALTFDL